MGRFEQLYLVVVSTDVRRPEIGLSPIAERRDSGLCHTG